MYGMPGRSVRSFASAIGQVLRASSYGGLQRDDVRDEGPGAGPPLDPAFGVQLVVRRLRHGPRDPELPREVARGRQPMTGLEPPVQHRRPELFRELQVQRQSGGPVDRQRQRSLHFIRIAV